MMGSQTILKRSLKIVKRPVSVVILVICLVGLVEIVGSAGTRAFGSQIHRIDLGLPQTWGDGQKRCVLDEHMTVSVAGLPRSGSTIAYNIVRMLLIQYQPSLLYGWIDELISNKTMRDYVSKDYHDISIVYKTHRLEQHLVQNNDLVIFTHRDPIEQVCSLGLMFDQDILTNCTQAQIQCRWLEGLQRDLYSNATHGSIVDLDYEELSNPLSYHKAVDKIADKLSLDAGCISPSFFHEISRLRPPADGVFSDHHPFTLMHAGHTHANTSQCDVLHMCLLGDSDCKSWISRGGRIRG